MKKYKNNSNGNVLFLILIAVALFAALSYAVTGSSRTGENGISKDKAKLYAARVVEFGAQMEQAVTRLKVLGTPEYGMDFQHNSSVVLNGANTTCTSNTCKIYNIEGGGLSPLESFPEAARDSKNPQYFNIRVGFGVVLDVGTDLPDLLLIVHGLSDEICHIINSKFNNRNASTEAFGGGMDKYEGNLTSLPATSPVTFGDNQAQYKGKYSFCAIHNTAGNYYAHILIAR